MLNLIGIAVLTAVTLTRVAAEEYLEVELQQGWVRGFLSPDEHTYRFLGVPYATAPQGNDRFKAPLGPPSWTGILNATNSNVRCVQPLVAEFTEDCLVVNVYVPAGVQQNSSMPVFVIIHGGAFFYGQGNQGLNDINRLLEQDIILVSYNYRLGALGFLCLGTDDAPGNAGLKDQVAALHWIKNNIASFGGDPNEVTVFGYSAGAGSLELLALSDAAEGLFNRIILESGSALASWAIAYDPVGAAKSAAEFLGFGNVDNLQTLAEIFINATPEELASVSANYFFMTRESSLLFGPCIETIIDSSTVIADSPINILRAKNYNPVPIMAIYTDMDGLFRLPQWEEGWDTQFMEHFADFLPPDLLFDDDNERLQVAEVIKQLYVDNTDDDLLAFVYFVTDTWFAYSMINSSVLHAENSVPVYLMEFSFHDEYQPLPGASHTDFFGHIFEARVYGPPNELVVERAIAMITNFITYNNPIPNTNDLLPVSWPTVTPETINYLAFDDQLTMRQSPIAERYELWRTIYETHYRELPLPDNDIDFLEISLEQGIVRGFRAEDRQSVRFFGIPYAGTPVGRDRYKAPLPPPTWTGVLNATDSTIRCLQTDYGGIREDCLVINVYIPSGLASNASVPVLAIIHGGGFIYGSGTQDLLEINRFMAEGVVLVSFNYRLGVLGYLCLGTETAPGNAGLKDQLAALRWIKNNIASFGGDPNDVTVFGYSGGSASVELLALSDASEGLMNRVILESGSALAVWAVAYDPIGTAKSAAALMGFPNVENLNTLEEIFINATPEEPALAALHWQGSLKDTTLGFCPCIEKILDNTTILAASPRDIMRSSNYNAVPTMAIYSDMEGNIRLADWEAGWNETFANSFSDFLPPHFSFENDEEKDQIAEEIKKFYIDNTENELLAFVDFITDIMFAYTITYSSVLHSNNSDSIFLMEFSFYDEYNPLLGASHIDFFAHVFNARLQGPANDEIAEKATKMIVNFMRYDNPVPSTSDLLPVLWPAVTPTAINYLSFNENFTARQSPIAERYQLWQSIYDRYYREFPEPNSGLAIRTGGLMSCLLIVCIFVINKIYL